MSIVALWATCFLYSVEVDLSAYFEQMDTLKVKIFLVEQLKI